MKPKRWFSNAIDWNSGEIQIKETYICSLIYLDYWHVQVQLADYALRKIERFSIEF